LARRTGLVDSLTELLGIKSGLALSTRAVIEQLENSEESSRWWEGDPLSVVRVRGEALESSFCHLLHRVGATPDRLTSWQLGTDFARRNAELLFSLGAACELPGMHPPEGELVSAVRSITTTLACGDMHPGFAPLLELLETIPGWDELRTEVARRFLLARSMPEVRSWDGIRALADLFDAELDVEATDGDYFDQRFIDYLSRNTSDLTAISWRQLECLAAEFFSRSGYDVQLGPGRKDGGVDVKAIRTGLLGPELVVVQCRRQGAGRPVGLDAVRAFWSVVQDDTATRGLIATTSRLTRGARTYCEARRYRLSAAEADNVRAWISSMASAET